DSRPRRASAIRPYAATSPSSSSPPGWQAISTAADLNRPELVAGERHDEEQLTVVTADLDRPPRPVFAHGIEVGTDDVVDVPSRRASRGLQVGQFDALEILGPDIVEH